MPHSLSMDGSSRQKISKAAEILKYTIELLLFSRHYSQKNNTDFSSAHVTFSRTDDILGHKTSCNKFKRIVTILSIFSNYNGVKLKINHRKRNKKKLDCMKTSNKILKNHCQ